MDGDSDNDGVANDDDATGDGSNRTSDDDANAGDEPDKDSGSIEDGDASKVSTPTALSRSSIAPANFNAKYVPLPTFNTATESMTFTVRLDTGFSASAGDTFFVIYDDDEVDLSAATSPVPVTGIDGLVAEVDPNFEEIVFRFEEEIQPLQEQVSGSVAISANVKFEACLPSETPYANYARLWFQTPSVSDYVVVEGSECPASSEPVIVGVEYDTQLGTLGVGILFANAPKPGKQLTLTYEQDKLAVESGPFELIAFEPYDGSVFNVGTVTASNGLITIDIFDANIPAGLESEFFAVAQIPGWLQGDTCADTNDPVHHPGGELEFVSNTGDTFTASFPPFACNLAGPSIVGEWDTDDLGQPVIHWTIDTGDLVLFAGIDSFDYMYPGPFIYDCDSLTITNVSGDYTVDDRHCSDSDFYYDLVPQSDEPFRATINVTTALDLDPANLPLSLVNCVDVWMWDEDQPEPEMLSTQSSNGWGGEACYEMFLNQDDLGDPVGGDFLTKSVDKTEALTGEVLTYSIEVTTTTDLWNVIDLGDTLPEGFQLDPDSITCTVEPASYQTDPCFVQSGSTLRVQVRERVPDPERPWERETAPVTITLTYQGEITGEPGAVLASEACSVRTHFWLPIEGESTMMTQVEGDQSVIGGGRICSEASTLVLQDEDDDPIETPTPSPTAEPGETPTPSPTTAPGVTPTSETPTETAEPEEKQTVIRVEMWDGSSIEGASWSLYAPVASQVMVDPYLTGVLDANNSAVLIDLPDGEYRFVVAPEDVASQEFLITVSDESEEIVVQFVGNVTPVPTDSATPGSPTEPTAESDPGSQDASAVTGLPSTGQGSSSAGIAVFTAAIAASMLMAVAVGIRIRSPGS